MSQWLSLRLVAVLALVLTTVAAQARDCYVNRSLVRNDKTLPIEPVCRAMAKNLNRFCDQPPMVCGLKIHHAYQRQFSLPEWKPVPPDMALIEAFIRAPWRMPQTTQFEDNAWNREKRQVTAALADNRLQFAAAQVDIYNLGKKELTYRLDFGDCETKNPQVNQPATQNTWGYPLADHLPGIGHAPEVVRRLFSRYEPIESTIDGDLFIFRGSVYAYGMWGRRDPSTAIVDNLFWINRYERVRLEGLSETNLHMRNVCEIEYHPYEEASE